MYIYLYMYIYIYVYINKYIYVYINTYIYIYIYIFFNIIMITCIYIYRPLHRETRDGLIGSARNSSSANLQRRLRLARFLALSNLPLARAVPCSFARFFSPVCRYWLCVCAGDQNTFECFLWHVWVLGLGHPPDSAHLALSLMMYSSCSSGKSFVFVGYHVPGPLSKSLV